MLETNQSKINRLNQILSMVERQCLTNQPSSPDLDMFEDELDSVFSSQQQPHLELLKVDLSVPSELMGDF